MSFYAEERHAAIRAINMQNKQRARQMELRIAKKLEGNRIPMSGAGSIKGDCRVLTENYGEVMLECKYSASADHSGKKRIRLRFDWFEKLAKDVKSMRSRFGALVFHYHGDRLSDYVMVTLDDFERLSKLPENVRMDDYSGRSGFLLYQTQLDAFLREFNDHYLVSHNGTVYVIITLDRFKELIHGENNNSVQ